MSSPQPPAAIVEGSALFIKSYDRRALLLGAMLCAGSMAVARRPVIRTSAIRWTGSHGRTLHGYMAIPPKAHGRQPAVLVIGEPAALPPVPDPVARRIVDQVAMGGLLACTADNVTGLDDLHASLAWLRSNRYATGKVALVGFGRSASIAARLAVAEGDTLGALLVLNGDVAGLAGLPMLALGWQADDNALPAAATLFLKEHLA